MAGDGTGSGHVATTPGVEPAISCDLAGTSPSGACSATYPEGTVVDLVVTPAASVEFSGWAADAASCGTDLSCSLTINGNETATVKLGSPATGSGEVQVVSSVYYPDAEIQSITWVAELRNTTSQFVQSAEVEFSTLDAAGNVLATTSTFAGPIPPGENRGIQGLGDFVGTEASSAVRVINIEFGEVVNLAAAEIVSSSWNVDPASAAEGVIPWTVEVRNTSAAELGSVEIDFSTYDAAGKIVASSFTFLGPIAPGETQTSEGIADYHGTEASAKFQVANLGSEINVFRQKRLRAR
ncbi:MAG: FxLYD domain-containing protein [Acidimicrobiia bacterium]